MESISGANSYEWSKVYPHFTLGRQVIVPDLIGFGESERPDIAMDASDYAETLVEFLRNTCGDRRPAIVASGLTAGLALLLASRHPERVERLVLLLPTGLKGAGKWAATGMATLVRLPGFNRFVYRNYLSRAPFIRGWLTKFALGDPSRMNEEMVRALTTCAQQPALNTRFSASSAGNSPSTSNLVWTVCRIRSAFSGPIARPAFPARPERRCREN